jgi:hypothetical protein
MGEFTIPGMFTRPYPYELHPTNDPERLIGLMISLEKESLA